MGDLLDVATSYPVSPFTVLLLTSLGYWVVSTILGLGDLGMDSDLGIEVDGLPIDAESSMGVDAANAVGDGADSGEVGTWLLSATGIGVAPFSVVLSVFSLSAWFLATMIVTLWGSHSYLVGTGVLLGSGLIGLLCAGRAARLLRPLFTVVTATTHQQLIGKICVIRTGSVSSHFGQAEVIYSGDGDHLVQVRCREPNKLAAGDKALIVDVDDGIFTISADAELAQTLG